MKEDIKIIHNHLTGQIYQLIRTGQETAGEVLEMEVTYRAQSTEPPAHYHPYQTEDFKLLSGEMSVRIEQNLHVFHAGESFHIPPNVVHSMWNSGTEPTIVRWEITPALNSQTLFETLANLANDGKTNSQGVPNLLQISLTMRHFSGEFRLVKPPYWLQKILFGSIAPIARLLGYKPVYQPDASLITIRQSAR